MEPGDTLSHYRLIEKIGEGGMGVVWKAEDTVLGRTVAVKVLHTELASDERRKKMFLDEARLASSLSEAHIVQVHEFGREGDLDFIVMEYVEGKPLSQVLKGRSLAPDRIAEIGHQVARAIARAHRKGLIHRDLKPSNILITPEGDAKVVDFGLATLFTRGESVYGGASSVLTRTETFTAASPAQDRVIAGTLPYMSPEQVRGEDLDSRSDIFSLGVVLYEMTTGQRPFGGPTPSDVAQRIQDARPRPVHDLVPDVPLELDRSIHKALAPRRGDRYQTMDDLAVDLKRLGRDLESGSSPSYASTLSGTRRRAVRWRVAGAALLVLAAAIIGAWWMLPSKKSETTAQTTTPELDAKRVAVAAFENQTGDRSLDTLGRIVSERVAEGLAGIESVKVVPPTRISDLAQMGKVSSPAGDPLLALAEAAGAGLVVSGRYYLEGQSLSIQAKVTLAIENRLLQVVESPSVPREKAMQAVEALGKSIVWIVTVAQLDPSLLSPERKPPSYEVYEEWRKASELLGADNTGAIACYKRILELEPGFVWAHMSIAVAYANASDYAEAAKQLDILETMKERLTPMERLYAKSFKVGLAGRREESLGVSREIVMHFPHSTGDAYNLALAAIGANRPREAIEVLSRPLNWKYFLKTSNPFGTEYFFVIALAHHQLGEHEQELVEVRRGRRIYPESVGLATYEVIALVALGRLDEMETVIQETLGMPARPTQGMTPGWTLWGAAMGLRKSGHREASLKMAGRGVEWFRDHPGEELKLAQCLYLAERWQEAQTAYEALAREDPEELAHKGVLGCLAVRRGDPDEATRISEELRRIDRPYLFGANTRARASIAAQLGQKDRAVSLLREAVAQGYAVWDGDIAPYTTRFSWDPDLEPLHGYPPFEELIRPKG